MYIQCEGLEGGEGENTRTLLSPFFSRFAVDWQIDNIPTVQEGLLYQYLLYIFFREWRIYFKDPYNYFDWLGLILTFLVIPLRFAEVKYQWSVAALGYLFHFLRLFKFSCVTRFLFASILSLTLHSKLILKRHNILCERMAKFKCVISLSLLNGRSEVQILFQDSDFFLCPTPT